MTVYVDGMKDYGALAVRRGLPATRWCHLTADTERELHAFAKALGLRRSWYQRKGPKDHRWHYDITAPTRAEATRLGAREVDRRFMGRLMILRSEEAARSGQG
ncbi:DUF4031 domain-containing protein [Streptomyces sp. CBMA152]|uniref:DUF4031 domain-containing protein n=1 Tax=unclassified Streptomyces TaxID=2593676 RepID=UPI002948C2D4|nr:DUF4031 domain-containing protein [Streptomyces sp. CBMA152]MBD0742824.1 hypothetical protein [Streptomyces sp. CBMA152]